MMQFGLRVVTVRNTIAGNHVTFTLDAQYLGLLIGRKPLLFEIIVKLFIHFCPY